MSHRLEQVAAELRRRLQEQLSRGLSDPRVRGLVSITEVTVAPDLSEAYINVSVLPAQHGPLTLKGLRHAAGHLQTEVARGSRLRRVPRLSFRLDESIKEQAELESAIRKTRDEATEEGPDSSPAAGPHEENPR